MYVIHISNLKKKKIYVYIYVSDLLGDKNCNLLTDKKENFFKKKIGKRKNKILITKMT